MHGLDKIVKGDFFKINDRDIRGHDYKIVVQACRRDIRKYSVNQRVVWDWNRLPAEVVGACRLNMFKNVVDHYLRYTRGLV